MKNSVKLVLALALVVAIFAISAFAADAPTLQAYLVEADGVDNAYDVIFNLDTKSEGSDTLTFQVEFSFNNKLLTPADCDDYSAVALESVSDEPVFPAAVQVGKKTYTFSFSEDPAWTTNGDKTSVRIGLYTTNFDAFDASDLDIVSVSFLLADGKTVTDIGPNDFTIDSIYLASKVIGEAGYNFSEAPDPFDSVVNSVVTERTIINVPVTLGDVIYLTDGTVAVADADGDYEVSGEGIIVVNTDTTAQKVYEIKDGAVTEVKALENAVLSSMAASIRGYGGINAAAKNKPGIRFLADFAKALKENSDVEEYGFMVTVDSEYNDLPDEYVLNSALVDTGKAIASAVYDGENDIYNYEEGDRTIVTVAFYGMPLTETNVLTDITARPYVKLTNGAIIYGEPATRQTYEVAWGVKNAGGEAYTKAKDYIDAILALVQETEKDVVIDVGPLF